MYLVAILFASGVFLRASGDFAHVLTEGGSLTGLLEQQDAEILRSKSGMSNTGPGSSTTLSTTSPENSSTASASDSEGERNGSKEQSPQLRKRNNLSSGGRPENGKVALTQNVLRQASKSLSLQAQVQESSGRVQRYFDSYLLYHTLWHLSLPCYGMLWVYAQTNGIRL